MRRKEDIVRKLLLGAIFQIWRCEFYKIAQFQNSRKTFQVTPFFLPNDWISVLGIRKTQKPQQDGTYVSVLSQQTLHYLRYLIICYRISKISQSNIIPYTIKMPVRIVDLLISLDIIRALYDMYLVLKSEKLFRVKFNLPFNIITLQFNIFSTPFFYMSYLF